MAGTQTQESSQCFHFFLGTCQGVLWADKLQEQGLHVLTVCGSACLHPPFPCILLLHNLLILAANFDITNEGDQLSALTRAEQ